MAALLVLLVLPGLLVLFLIVAAIKAFQVVKEKEVMVIERLGEFHCVLTAGVHYIVPFIDRPKVFLCYLQYAFQPLTSNIRRTHSDTLF